MQRVDTYGTHVTRSPADGRNVTLTVLVLGDRGKGPSEYNMARASPARVGRDLFVMTDTHDCPAVHLYIYLLQPVHADMHAGGRAGVAGVHAVHMVPSHRCDQIVLV